MFPLFRIWIWPVWLAFALVLSIPSFRRELDYTHPPAKLAGLVALVVAMGLWVWLRRRWPRAELLVLAAAFLIPALIREPRATATVAAMSMAALAFGRCACSWLKLSMSGRVEEVVGSAAIGFGAWIVVLIALGAADALYVPVIVLVIALALILCWRGLQRLLQLTMEIYHGWNEPDVLTGIQMFAILVMIGSMHLVMLTPSIYFDSFASHLATANYYTLHHALAPVPTMSYSGFPQGFELMMSAAALLAGQAGAQMISPLFLVLALAALYALARELGASRQVGIAGAVFGLTIPAMQWSGSVVKNDLLLAFLLLFAMLGAVRYWNSRTSTWLYAVAFAGAAAQDVKLSAAIATAPLAMLLLAAWWRNGGHWRKMAIALTVVIAFGTYFPIRNKLVFGSAVYPGDLYKITTPGIAHDLKLPPAIRAINLATLPWKLQFHGTWAFDGQNATPLGFFFLLFLPACFWMRRRDWTPAVLGCVFFASCYLLAWALTWPILRYAAVPIGMLAAGLSLGIVRTLRAAPAWLKVLLLAAVIYCHVYNWSVMASLGVRMERLQLLAGKMNADRFLRLMVPTYASAAWLRDHARPGEQTLSVGNYALAYMGDPGLVNVILDEQGPFPVSNIREALAAKQYRYLLLPRAVNPEQLFAGRISAPALQSADERYLVFQLE